MTTAFRASTHTDHTGSGASLTIPITCQSGDNAIIGIGVISATAIITTPTGWTPIPGAAAQDSAYTVKFFSRVLTAPDPGATVTGAYTIDTGQKMNMLFGAWSGGGPTLDGAVMALDTNAFAHVAPNMTPSVSGEFVIAMEMELASAQATAFSSSGGTLRESDLPSGSGASSTQGCIVDSGIPIASGVLSAGWTITSTAHSFSHSYILVAGIEPAVSVQTVRPISGITETSWTNVGGAASIAAAEADTSDVTFAESTTAPAGQTLEEKLATPSAALASVTVRARISGGASSGSMVVDLVQNTTILQTWTQSGITNAFADYTFTVTGTGLSGQTDLTNLRIRVLVTAS